MHEWLTHLPGEKRKGLSRNRENRLSLPSAASRETTDHSKRHRPRAPLQDFSAKDAIWLFVRDPDKLDKKEQETLAAICQASETARTTYQLVQEFRNMLHQRTGEKLDPWLEKIRASQVRELQSFVAGIERDKAAVVAGLTLPYNNGLVEGKVNKLKLIKRMGYGRAGFALLRQRVFHAL
jgi:transposase